jgi:stage II sporulation protein GA (sporulation sigma-E factor processing peptidase)
VIYLDVLLCVNLFLNYMMMMMTARFLGLPYQKGRLLLGALSGTAFAPLILLPSLGWYFQWALKLIPAAVMVVVGYRLSGVRDFWKHFACLYGVTFAFGGLLLAVTYLVPLPGLVVRNGVVYASVPPLVLLAMTVVCYVVLSLLYRITGRHQSPDTVCTLELFHNGGHASVLVKVDTGNTLTEPFSGLPVAVIEAEALSALHLPAIDDDPLSGEMRLIPYHTASGSGVFYGFRPQRCQIRRGKTVLEAPAFYVALSDRRLGTSCHGLLHPDIAEGCRKQRMDPQSVCSKEGKS